MSKEWRDVKIQPQMILEIEEEAAAERILKETRHLRETPATQVMPEPLFVEE